MFSNKITIYVISNQFLFTALRVSLTSKPNFMLKITARSQIVTNSIDIIRANIELVITF